MLEVADFGAAALEFYFQKIGVIGMPFAISKCIERFAGPIFKMQSLSFYIRAGEIIRVWAWDIIGKVGA
jgi:hypothetical protein